MKAMKKMAKMSYHKYDMIYKYLIYSYCNNLVHKITRTNQ